MSQKILLYRIKADSPEFACKKQEKQAFFYYREGLAAQCAGEYAEALENYYEALQIEEDPYDRSYILYNIGLLYTRYIYIYSNIFFPKKTKLNESKNIIIQNKSRFSRVCM